MQVIYQFWWDWGLLAPAFISGLLGGAVYVNAFTLIARDVSPEPVRELALSAASVADSFGILLSDATGVLIQGCLFRWHGIPGAAYACECCAPFNGTASM